MTNQQPVDSFGGSTHRRFWRVAFVALLPVILVGCARGTKSDQGQTSHPGKSERMRLQPGDFFADGLPVADAYLLMEVIHDWNDQDAAKILAAVRRAALEHARLLIIEALASESPGPHHSKLLDVIMLAVTGGRERTPSEYEALFAGAGFRLERVIPTLSQHSIVEAVVI